MNIYPAIDIIGGEAVRLLKGDYQNKTVYGDPFEIAMKFKALGAKYIHIVDLDGAKSGDTPNIDVITKIAKESGLSVEIGGGIRSIDVIEKYLNAGVSRVILGTVAVKNKALLKEAVNKFGEKIAVGADVLDGRVKTDGWFEDSGLMLDGFLDEMSSLGVKTVICTDISKDGAMNGTNRGLYQTLVKKYQGIDIVASGGVSTIDDVIALKESKVSGAIIGKAYYVGAIDLKKAIEVAK